MRTAPVRRATELMVRARIRRGMTEAEADDLLAGMWKWEKWRRPISASVVSSSGSLMWARACSGSSIAWS